MAPEDFEVAAANLAAILADHGCESVSQLARNLYKYTDCGASLGARVDDGHTVACVWGGSLDALPEGAAIVALLVSSMVEGVDEETELHEVDLTDAELEPEAVAAIYDHAVSEVEREAEDIWMNTHGCATCAKHWGTDLAVFIDTAASFVTLAPVWPDCPDCKGEGVAI